MIEKPGIYTDFPAVEYFADPTPEPSVTQSLIKTLLDQSPAHARAEHPRLMPADGDDEEVTEKYSAAKAIGDAVHLQLLGRGKKVAIGSFDAWTTKVAKEFKAAAIADGATPILSKHWERAMLIVEIAQNQLEMRGLLQHFAPDAGDSEVVLAWQEWVGSPGVYIWHRTMIDRLSAGRRVVIDIKTTGLNAAPHAIGSLMADAGWPLQAAMHERGLNVLDPDNAGRRRHLFIVIEQYPPFALAVYEVGEALLHMGRKRLQTGLSIWGECMRTGLWPAYPIGTMKPEMPGWVEKKWLEAEQEAGEDLTFAG